MTHDTYSSFMTNVKDLTVSDKHFEEEKTSKAGAIESRVCQEARWTGEGEGLSV